MIKKGDRRIKNQTEKQWGQCSYPQTSIEVMYQIKKELKRKQLWLDHKTGRGVNREEKWNKISLYPYIPHPS